MAVVHDGGGKSMEDGDDDRPLFGTRKSMEESDDEVRKSMEDSDDEVRKSMEDSDDDVPTFGTRKDEQKAIEAIEALCMLQTPLGNAKLCFKGVTGKE